MSDLAGDLEAALRFIDSDRHPQTAAFMQSVLWTLEAKGRIETGDLVKTLIPVIQALEESTIQVGRASHPEED
jgi:hypothetical protein